jgi:hypothetical protein
MPDIELETAEGRTRVYALLHDARPLLVNLGATKPDTLAPWADRVRLCTGVHHGPWEIPVLGSIPPPLAMLIRPDGHVAWVGEIGDATLAEALAKWCGSEER